MPAIWTQSFPPRAAFTEKSIESQRGKVFIVTGGASGVGFQLASILYNANGTVYIAGRSTEKAESAIEQIKNDSGGRSQGRLEFLFLDLSDLNTVAPAVKEFKSQQSKLDVLWNNAGVGAEVGNVRSAQGSEMHFATNCTGPLLFTRLLRQPLEAAQGVARVIWTASMTVDFDAPPGGLVMENLETPTENGAKTYACSKAGNWLIAGELARQEALNANQSGADQIKVIHLVINPGNLRTPIWRYVNWFFVQFLDWTMLYPAINGAYTALWAGLSAEIHPEDSGRYIIPWGRWHPNPREDILTSIRSPEDGGTGLARGFVEWCEKKFEAYM